MTIRELFELNGIEESNRYDAFTFHMKRVMQLIDERQETDPSYYIILNYKYFDEQNMSDGEIQEMLGIDAEQQYRRKRDEAVALYSDYLMNWLCMQQSFEIFQRELAS